jgi:hypothetical protein
MAHTGTRVFAITAPDSSRRPVPAAAPAVTYRDLSAPIGPKIEIPRNCDLFVPFRALLWPFRPLPCPSVPFVPFPPVRVRDLTDNG